MAQRTGSRRSGKKLRAIRKDRGLTTTQAAAAARLSENYWVQMETGLKPITDSALVKIAPTLGRSIDSLDDALRVRRLSRRNGAAA